MTRSLARVMAFVAVTVLLGAPIGGTARADEGPKHLGPYTLGPQHPDAEDADGDGIIHEYIDVELPDGTLLVGCAVRPVEIGVHPVTLEWTNYTVVEGKQDPAGHGCPPQFAGLADVLVPRGWIHLAVNTRGVGRSQGETADQWSVANGRDGVDVVRWIEAQPWSSGKTALVGCSSSAMEGLQVIANDPPELEAAVMGCFAVDSYRGAFYLGGIRNFTVFTFGARIDQDTDYGNGQVQEQLLAGETTALERSFSDAQVFGNAVAERTDGPFWRNTSTAERLDGHRVPVYAFVGWQDFFPRGGMEFAMLHRSPSDRVLVSPGGHGGARLSEGEFNLWNRAAAWVDWQLHGREAGRPDPFGHEKPIVYWVYDGGWRPGTEVGELPRARFRQTDVWPPAEVTWQRWYLDGTRSGTSTSTNDGTLSTDPVVDDTPAVWTYPAPGTAGTTDPRPLEQPQYSSPEGEEAGVVTWTSPKLSDDLTIAGPITFTFWAQSTAVDTDFYARLLTVAEDGSTQDITNGWLKASHRGLDADRTLRNDAGDVIRPFHAHDVVDLLTPGAPAEFQMEIAQTATTIPAGARLRLLLTSDLAPWAFQDIPPATNVLLSDAAHPSSLLLPVVDAKRLEALQARPTDVEMLTPASPGDDTGTRDGGVLPATGASAQILPLGILALVVVATIRRPRRT